MTVDIAIAIILALASLWLGYHLGRLKAFKEIVKKLRKAGVVDD